MTRLALRVLGVSNIPYTKKEIKSLVEKVLRAERVRGKIELGIRFCSNQEIKKLNRRYRKKNKPTDVLSFVGEKTPEKIRDLGTIVISYDKVRRQAKEYGLTQKQEAKRLLVHGLLHLLGYEHEAVPKDRVERMFDRQEHLTNIA